jgi:parallel beta-helix repeat protein
VTQVSTGAASPGRSHARLAAVLAVALIVAPVPVARAATYFVDRSSAACSNHGAGTEAQPYCSISAAVAARGGPGVTLVVRPGVYPEQVTLNASGATGSPFVLQAAAGGVVVDGADDFSDPTLWVRSSGEVWLAVSVTWTPAQAFADGARLTPSTSAPASLSARSFTWVAGEGLYMNAGGGNPAAHQVRVGHRKYGFSMYGRSWVTIEGFTIARTEDRGINLSGSCTNVTIARDTVAFANKMGIQVVGGSDIVIGLNRVSDNNDHGISLTGGATGVIVEDNEAFRNARPGARAANGIYLFGSPGNTLRRNRLHDNQDSGVHIQSGSNDCVSYLNRSWNNGDHGYDHLGASGTVHVCDVAYGNYKDGFSIEGGSPGTQLYNCIATNNGLTTNEFDLWVDLESTPGFTSNYNLFWNSTRQPPVKHIRTLYPSVAGYSAASGQDTKSLQADPRFVNPAAGDFHLNAGSPAIDNTGSRGPGWSATDAYGCPHPDVAAARGARLHPTREPRGP